MRSCYKLYDTTFYITNIDCSRLSRFCHILPEKAIDNAAMKSVINLQVVQQFKSYLFIPTHFLKISVNNIWTIQVTVCFYHNVFNNADSVKKCINVMLYRVTVSHVSIQGQFDVFRMNSRARPFLQTHDVSEDERINCLLVSFFFSDFMSFML